jgi:hypothetical protein
VIEYGLCRFTIVDPWKYCPAQVCAGEGMKSGDAIGSLKQSIPPELVSRVGLTFW